MSQSLRIAYSRFDSNITLGPNFILKRFLPPPPTILKQKREDSKHEVNHSKYALSLEFDIHEAIFVNIFFKELPNVIGGFPQLIFYFYKETFTLAYLQYFHTDVFHKHEDGESQFDAHAGQLQKYMVKLGPLWSNCCSPSTTMSAYRSLEYFYQNLSRLSILLSNGYRSLNVFKSYFFSYYFFLNKNINIIQTAILSSIYHKNKSIAPFKSDQNYFYSLSFIFSFVSRITPTYNQQLHIQYLYKSIPDLFVSRECNIKDSYKMAQQHNFSSDKVQKILLELNKTGLSYLKYLQFKEAIDFFKKAQKIVNQELNVSTNNQKVNQLAGVTFNNLACYYKKTRKPKVALHYLKKSLEIQVYKINDWVSTGSTHLNICAIYSYIGKHEEALSHAKLAIQLLQKKHYDTKDESQESRSYWNIKMLCFYNMAIEQQYLKVYEKSLQSFLKAKEIAKYFGSKNIGIILSCDQAISRIEMHLAQLKKKMISYFMKKKEDDQNGYHQYMRLNRPTPKRVNAIMSQDKLNKFSLYQNSDERKKGTRTGENKFRIKPHVSESVERRSNSTKFKSLNEYFNQKFRNDRAETQSDVNHP